MGGKLNLTLKIYSSWTRSCHFCALSTMTSLIVFFVVVTIIETNNISDTAGAVQRKKTKYILRRKNKINECNYDQNKGNISKMIGWYKIWVFGSMSSNLSKVWNTIFTNSHKNINKFQFSLSLREQTTAMPPKTSNLMSCYLQSFGYSCCHIAQNTLSHTCVKAFVVCVCVLCVCSNKRKIAVLSFFLIINFICWTWNRWFYFSYLTFSLLCVC